MPKLSKKTSLILSLFALIFVAACGTQTLIGEQVAMRLASPVWMIKREITAGPFTLTAFERMHTRNAKATIYIEGDGFERSLPDPEQDPTPINPVALHMATKDKAENIAYLARPCQFTELLKEKTQCSSHHWTEGRYSGVVLNAYNEALDDIKRRYNITSLNLIGYDGGGGIATILAAQRSDILSLRTVAGNLDTMAYATHHKIVPLKDSLNPADFAHKLQNMPQAHFIGGQDRFIVPSNLQSYLQKLGPSNCVTYDLIQEAEHHEGWVEKWPELLAKTPTCKGPTVEPVFYERPKPIYRPRDPCLEKGGSCVK